MSPQSGKSVIAQQGTRGPIGRRVLAGFLDLLVCLGLLLAVSLALGQYTSYHDEVQLKLHGVGIAVFLALVALYYFTSELLTGQTLGKRVSGLIVVRADGGRPGAASIAGRTLLRGLDFLPFFYLGGFLVMFTRGGRRIGDLAAGTAVVAKPAAQGEALICGIGERQPRVPLRKTGFSWPLGRLDFDDVQLVGSSPVFFGRFPIRVRYAEIDEAIVTPGLRPFRTGATIRLRMLGGERGDVTITTVDDRYQDVVGVLRGHGVRIHE